MKIEIDTQFVINKIRHTDAYLLAGGKSSRMGSDKGLLLFRNKTLIERIIEQLQPLFEKLIIVSNNPEYQKFGLEVIEDLIKDIGPAGGIHAALNHTKADGIFVVSCDMPFITTKAVQFILKNSLNQQITLPFHQGKIQPLSGVYSRDCFKKWERLIEQKIIKLQQMVTHFELSKVNVDDHQFFNEIVFMNINDKNDLNKALQQL